MWLAWARLCFTIGWNRERGLVPIVWYLLGHFTPLGYAILVPSTILFGLILPFNQLILMLNWPFRTPIAHPVDVICRPCWFCNSLGMVWPIPAPSSPRGGGTSPRRTGPRCTLYPNTWDLVLRCQKNLRLRNVTFKFDTQWKFNRGCLVFNCGWDDGRLRGPEWRTTTPPAHHPPDGWCLSCDLVCGWTWTWVKIWFHLGNLFWRCRSYI